MVYTNRMAEFHVLYVRHAALKMSYCMQKLQFLTNNFRFITNFSV